ncbi:MAG: hypothetical protein HQM01_13815 [Magnetococcales bacterium]|nr:hypothetical protein [Magnetococcales bacterium]
MCDDLISMTYAAHLLGIHPNTLKRKHDQGIGPKRYHVKGSTSVVYHEGEVLTFKELHPSPRGA